jgi:hypothetical protein
VSDDESFKTSLRNDINNYIKQHFDSEAINATVDAAKDPWFAKLNVVFQNIGVVNFMKNLGIPFERIVMFVNQPVLRAYVTLQQNGMSKLDALAEVGSRLGIAHQFSGKEELLYMDNEEDKAKYEQLKSNPEVTMELDEDAGDGFTKVKYSSSKPATYFDLINAFQAIEGHQPLKAGLSHLNDVLHYRPITPDMLKDRLENEDGSGDDFNLRILAHFVMMDQHQQAFRDFQRYFSFDKKKVSTPTEIKDKETLRHRILETGMFTTADIEKMEQNSIQTSFINNDTLSRMFNKVLPVFGQEEVQNTLNTLYKSYTSNFDQKNKRDERNMPKVLNSDFVRALIFNFNVENGQSLSSVTSTCLSESRENVPWQIAWNV